jgi:transposase
MTRNSSKELDCFFVSGGYYAQLCVNDDVTESIEPNGKTIGLDVFLTEFYTDYSI